MLSGSWLLRYERASPWNANDDPALAEQRHHVRNCARRNVVEIREHCVGGQLATRRVLAALDALGEIGRDRFPGHRYAWHEARMPGQQGRHAQDVDFCSLYQ